MYIFPLLHPSFAGNGKTIAYDIIASISTLGVVLLICIIIIITSCIVVYLRKKKRNRKIDRYLHVLKESENSFEETCDYMDQTQMKESPYRHGYSMVGNAAYDTSMSDTLSDYQTERTKHFI